jgi:ABC-type uncharacterized transport system permease subunit
MSINILTLIVAVMYFLTSILVFRGLQRRASRIVEPQNRVYLLSLIATLIFHAILLKLQIISPAGLKLSFGHTVSLIMWMMVFLYMLMAILRPVTSLGIVMLPLAILSLLVETLLPGHYVLTHARPLMNIHITVAILAYSLLALSGVQALIINSQERALRTHKSSYLNKQLPPLETMETLLFNMIYIGFGLLTLTMLSALLFFEQIFGRPFHITHHIVFSASAWLVFGIFLLGHWRWGWRGRNAALWTIGGVVLLVLGFVGTKFVLEFLIRR